MTGIDAALAEAEAHHAARRPRTAAMHERARAVLPGGNTRTILHTAPFPIRVAAAEGATITDVDGHTYLDLLGEYSAGIYGHSHPRIRRAAMEALDMGVNLGAQHMREVELAEAVTRRFGLDFVRFTNSGTEANMMALAAARCFTGRDRIMPMWGGYHGGTLFFNQGAAPVNAPYDCVLGRYNDTDATRALIDSHGQRLAAVIVEPMLGGGGCIPAEAGYLAMLREETERRGIVLIFDEVMTSRLAPGGLAAQLGIAADLATLGKYVGGGMSFGAFGGRRAIMEQFDPARPDAIPHAGTFNNNTLTMTAGVAGLTEVFTPEACLALNARGDRLRDRLNDLFMSYQVRLSATGIGSMMTVHPLSGALRRPEDLAKADKRLRRLLFLDLLDAGLYIAERGFVSLSLMIADSDCDRLASVIEDFIKRRREFLVQDEA
jgi:glutamate-1-semialdehyde 2,1-aminomutase